MFTGQLSTTRALAARGARRAGARVAGKVSGNTDVVVQGAPSASYKFGDVGIKLREVGLLRRRGYTIWVIGESEFRALVSGRGLSRAASDAALWGVTDALGVPWRTAPSSRGRLEGSLSWNLDALDRARQAHEKLVQRFATAIRASGFEPLTQMSEPAYDVGWRAGRRFFVVEVKTTTPTNERQQVRLGLGQVIEYRAALKGTDRSASVVGVLAVPSRPETRLVAACESVGIDLITPREFRSYVASNGWRSAPT